MLIKTLKMSACAGGCVFVCNASIDIIYVLCMADNIFTLYRNNYFAPRKWGFAVF